MIGKLKGVIDAYGEDLVIVDVQGVGYIVHCSARTLQNLPPVGEAAQLAIETHVREDMIRLYGFRSDAEREWFRLLQTVQGVGARVALGILSVLDPGALATAVATGDKGMINSLRKTVRTAGVRGLFDGISGTWLRQMTYSICRFWAYDESKKFLGAGEYMRAFPSPITPPCGKC